MAETTPRGIQATLFDYFQDTEYFDLQEANELLLEHQQRDINTESIRARIYEGIDKGLFERVGKGLYTVTRKDEQGKENTCLLINGDGRDLSIFPDNSLDAIVTDHPYALTSSLKGGNRNFADYELFQYNEEDFKEKQRVLKPGHFLVEFLPEENGDNYRYLFQVKEFARQAGLDYYAKVPWKKGDFVANTGRKSKNTEDIVLFTKGRARELRPDAKKEKQYAASHEIIEFTEHIPGSKTVHYSDMGGIGTSSETEIKPIDVNIHISVLKEDAERARNLLETAWDNAVEYNFEDSPLDQDLGGEYSWDKLFDMPVQDYILKYLKKCDLSFDDLSNGPVEHFMSGAHGMLPTVFDVAPPGKKEKIHQAEKPVQLLEQILTFVTKEDEWVLDQFAGSGALGEAALKTHRNSILIEKDADTFAALQERIEALRDVEPFTEAERKALQVGVDALEAVENGGEQMKALAEYQNGHAMPLTEASHTLANIRIPPAQDALQGALNAARKAIEMVEEQNKKTIENQESLPKTLECSSRGDRRFSALFAMVTINGKERSIETWYQEAKRTADGKKAGKGKPFDHIIDPFTGDALPASEATSLYRGLWITYLHHHPDLVEYASQFDDFTDSFRGEKTMNCQADIIGAYVKGDRDHYVADVKASRWYQNMVSKKKPLSQQIRTAQAKSAEQLSMFDHSVSPRTPWEQTK